MTAHAGKERGDRPWVAFTARLPTRAAFAALAAMLCALAIAAFVFAPPARSQGESGARRSEEHTSELQSLMRISYAVFCLKTTNNQLIINTTQMVFTQHH